MILAGKLNEDKITDKIAEAMDLGEYLYVFDRCISAGYDTVVLEKSKMRNKDADIYMVEDAAKKKITGLYHQISIIYFFTMTNVIIAILK